MLRKSGTIVLVAAMGPWIAAHPAEAVLNNGFETDWVYVIRSTGEVRAFNESDGAFQTELLGGMLNGSLTFAGTGANDARLFVARPLGGFGGSDIELFEVSSSGTILKSTTIETIVGDPNAVIFTDFGNIRYSAFHNTLFVAFNPDDQNNTPSVVYEIDLDLSTRIHTYIGPTVLRRRVTVDINSRDGTLYMTNRNMANAPGPIDNQGDLIAFSTAGRTVGGTTSTFTTLIDGTSYSATDPRWNQPECPIYRRAANPEDDTIVILLSPMAGAAPELEFYLDTTAHPPVGGNLALKGSPISAARAFGGQQDDVTGHVWFGAVNGGFHVIRTDGSTGSFTSPGNFIDADSPFSPAPAPPVILEVTPDPEEIGAGVEYQRQLGLQSGTPPITWTLLQAPAGAQIDSNGLIFGWTPHQDEAGLMFTFEVQASNPQGSDTETWQVEVLATNNGFFPDYVYTIRETGELRARDELDGQEKRELFTGLEHSSLIFSGRGRNNDARLFVARANPENTDIQIMELDASGAVVNSNMLSSIVGGPVGSAIILGNIRYSGFHETLFVGLNPNYMATTPDVCYEIDLGLSTRIHTYIGPPSFGQGDPEQEQGRNANIAIHERTGTLYMIGRHLGEATGSGQGDLVAFETAGRAVGGTTTTFATLIDGPTFAAIDSRYAEPHSVIYRRNAGDGQDDTILILMSPSAGAAPALEFWLDTAAHPSGNPNHLALRGSPISAPRGWNGQQDEVTGTVWFGALRGGLHALLPDDGTLFFTGGNWVDADSPPFQPCNEPFADADGDGDVDLDDFGLFQRCYTGTFGSTPAGCGCFDREKDGDVDNFDFGALRNCATGANVPWSPDLTPGCDP